jgi:predicted XRE-type DNA-binding protein
MKELKSTSFWHLWSMTFEDACNYIKDNATETIRVKINKKELPVNRKIIMNMVEIGLTQQKIADVLEISQPAVFKIIQEENKKEKKTAKH